MHNKLPDQVEFWNKAHAKTNELPNKGEAFPLALQTLPFLEARQASPILDLGCGACNDAIYFAQRHFEVHAVDFSCIALDKARVAIERNGKGDTPIHLCLLDLSTQLPFEDEKFRTVYSHLGLHYFDDPTTRTIFSEIFRLLQKDGLLAFNVKSVHDFLYGEGTELGPDMYDYKGHIRHFFRKDYVEQLLVNWHVLLLEEYEEFYGELQTPSSFLKVIAIKP